MLLTLEVLVGVQYLGHAADIRGPDSGTVYDMLLTLYVLIGVEFI